MSEAGSWPAIPERSFSSAPASGASGSNSDCRRPRSPRGSAFRPSYINLIERNQRPVTAQILLRLAETYDLDLRDLATADEDRFFAELNEIFSDPLFRQIDLPKQELRDLAELCPGVTHSLQRLVRRLYRSPPRRDPGRSPNGRPRRGHALRGQSDRARARPDRGQPQLFPRARTGGGNAARRIERVVGGTVRRARHAPARKAFDRHPHHAGRRDARDPAAVRPPSPATADLGIGRWTRPRVPARVPDRADRMRRQFRHHRRSRRPARRHRRAGSTGLRWRIISPPP